METHPKSLEINEKNISLAIFTHSVIAATALILIVAIIDKPNDLLLQLSRYFAAIALIMNAALVLGLKKTCARSIQLAKSYLYNRTSQTIEMVGLTSFFFSLLFLFAWQSILFSVFFFFGVILVLYFWGHSLWESLSKTEQQDGGDSDKPLTSS